MTDPVTRPPATDEVPQDASAASPQAVAALSDMETDWRRLDPRMLLVHLVQETFRLLPVLFGIIILGRSSDNGQNWFEWVFIPLVVGIVLLRYLTTRYRITNGQTGRPGPHGRGHVVADPPGPGAGQGGARHRGHRSRRPAGPRRAHPPRGAAPA